MRAQKKGESGLEGGAKGGGVGGVWEDEGGTEKKRKTHLSISMQMHASDSFRNPIRLSPRQGVLL